MGPRSCPCTPIALEQWVGAECPMAPPALQERLGQQQRDMEEERNRLQEVIGKMEARLNEQSRLLEQVGHPPAGRACLPSTPGVPPGLSFPRVLPTLPGSVTFIHPPKPMSAEL